VLSIDLDKMTDPYFAIGEHKNLALKVELLDFFPVFKANSIKNSFLAIEGLLKPAQVILDIHIVEPVPIICVTANFSVLSMLEVIVISSMVSVELLYSWDKLGEEVITDKHQGHSFSDLVTVFTNFDQGASLRLLSANVYHLTRDDCNK